MISCPFKSANISKSCRHCRPSYLYRGWERHRVKNEEGKDNRGHSFLANTPWNDTISAFCIWSPPSPIFYHFLKGFSQFVCFFLSLFQLFCIVRQGGVKLLLDNSFFVCFQVNVEWWGHLPPTPPLPTSDQSREKLTSPPNQATPFKLFLWLTFFMTSSKLTSFLSSNCIKKVKSRRKKGWVTFFGGYRVKLVEVFHSHHNSIGPYLVYSYSYLIDKSRHWSVLDVYRMGCYSL